MTAAYDAVVVMAAEVGAVLHCKEIDPPPGLGVAIILEPYTWADFAADPRVPNSVQPNGSIVILGVAVVCGKP